MLSQMLNSLRIPPAKSEILWKSSMEGIEMAIWTFVGTVLLELWCLESTKMIMKQNNGEGYKLYTFAVLSNLRNHFVFGWPIYAFAATMFCPMNAPPSAGDRVSSVLSILLIHSLWYYAVHRAFHTYPSLYRHHRFHHRFNVHVSPMVANAVSPVEYIVAYIVPFAIAMALVGPDSTSVRISVAIISLTNILIHTPRLTELSANAIPEWWVTTDDHLEHHRKLNTKYAAPTFNIDYLANQFGSSTVTKD